MKITEEIQFDKDSVLNRIWNLIDRVHSTENIAKFWCEANHTPTRCAEHALIDYLVTHKTLTGDALVLLNEVAYLHNGGVWSTEPLTEDQA